MTHFSTFTLSFAAFLCLMGVSAAWTFRSSSAPLAAKLIIPVLLVIVAIETPYAVASMLGFPTTSAPPAEAELIAYVAHDDTGRADLWLRNGVQPRAYDVTLDDSLKKTLHEAQERKEAGQRVMLRKATRKGPEGVPSPAPVFQIDPAAFALPQKDH